VARITRVFRDINCNGAEWGFHGLRQSVTGGGYQFVCKLIDRGHHGHCAYLIVGADGHVDQCFICTDVAHIGATLVLNVCV